MDMENLEGVNINKPCIPVKHSDLTRVGGSHYKSICPTCKEGFLLIYRNWDDFTLERLDRCILCGQQYEYLDIEDLRNAERGFKSPKLVAE
jgi:hypothetical protein